MQSELAPMSASPPTFPAAAQPDIVRAHQKDESYLQMLTDSCHDAVRTILGPRRALLCSRSAFPETMLCPATLMPTLVAVSYLSALLKVRHTSWLRSASRETRLVAELLYFGLTTGAGGQTLGEQYCDILQVSGEQPAEHLLPLAPSAQTRN